TVPALPRARCRISRGRSDARRRASSSLPARRDMDRPMANKTVIDGIAGLEALAGKDLGKSEWRTMKYEDIVRVADATGDHQWIHVDRERVKRDSPFGAPIAHGYFTLSLIAGLFFEMVETRNFGMVINYGLNKVRFPAPPKEGQRYRLAMKLQDAKQAGGAVDALVAGSIELQGEAKPASAAAAVLRADAR